MLQSQTSPSFRAISGPAFWGAGVDQELKQLNKLNLRRNHAPVPDLTVLPRDLGARVLGSWCGSGTEAAQQAELATEPCSSPRPHRPSASLRGPRSGELVWIRN